MTTTPNTSSPGPSRGRHIAARTLVVLGVVFVAVSLLSNWVKREALDPETFRTTSEELIAHPAIQDQVAQAMVDQLYANVDVSAQLQQKLPPNLQSLAAPIAGLGQEVIDRAATELLGRPRVQTLFITAASLAQSQVVKVLEGDTTRLSTTNGDVVLDLHPLVVQLGDRFGFLGDVSTQLPPDAGRITILQSDELDTAQSVTQLLKTVADWIWIPVLLPLRLRSGSCPGRRRKEVRAIAIGLVVAGVALLVIRRVAGSYLVDHLTSSDSVRPAVSAFWTILSDGLAEAAWVVVFIGVIGTLGAWLTGEGRRAVAARRWLGPWLANAGIAWAVYAAVLLIVVWALPLHRFVTTAILVVLGGRRVRGRPTPDRRRVRGGGPRAAPRAARRCRGGSPRRRPRRLRSRSSSGSRGSGRTATSPRRSTRRRRVGSCRRRGRRRQSASASPGDSTRTATSGARRAAAALNGDLRLGEVLRHGSEPHVQGGVRPPVDRDGDLRAQSVRPPRRAPSGSRCAPRPRLGPQPQIGIRARSRSGTSPSISGKRSVSPAK